MAVPASSSIAAKNSGLIARPAGFPEVQTPFDDLGPGWRDASLAQRLGDSQNP